MKKSVCKHKKISRGFEPYNHRGLRASLEHLHSMPHPAYECSRKMRRRLLHLAETREEGYKRTLVVVEIYHRLPRDVERASARALSARSREGCASVGHEAPRREENRVTARSRGTACSCTAEEGGQGRLITVAFCGFVARHDPRAFRGLHCSAPNRSGKRCRTVVRRGRVPVVCETY